MHVNKNHSTSDRTEISTLLTYLHMGTPVPDELLAKWDQHNIDLLRAIEKTMAANLGWRRLSVKLLNVAQQLNGKQSSTKIFDAIVQQARIILDADIGYISLNDESIGKTNVLATSGVYTEAFRTIQMPIGTGVLGLVAATNQPAWTYDHARDPQVTHVDYVDDAVRDEGIHGILGAPITIDGNTIGALLVGDRQPRNFTKDEITALSLLSSITAAALETARFIEDQKGSLEELTRARDEVHDHIVELQHVADADTELLQLLSGKATFAELAQFLGRHISPFIGLWHPDSHSFLTSESTNSATTEFLKTHAVRLLSNPTALSETVGQHSLPVYHYACKRQSPGEVSFTAFGVEFNGRHLGTIFTPVDQSPFTERIIAHGCSAFAAIALFQEALAAATSRKVDDLVYAAALGTIGPQETARLRQLTGVDIAKAENLYFVGIHAVKQSPRRTTIETALDCPTAVTSHENHFCVLLQTNQPINQTLEPLFSLGQTLYVSASKVTNEESLKDAHDMAMDFLNAAQVLDLRNEVVSESTLGSVGLILGAHPRTVELIQNQLVRTLTDYDGQHGTELEATAFAYLSNGHSIPATSKAMYVHANTIRQRIDRIAELIGHDWDKGSRSLDLHLALHVRALAPSERKALTG